MVFKKIGALGGALLLALSSLFTLAFSGQAQALGTTLYWCEFSSNSNFNIASNWNTNASCSGGTQEVPVTGDILVFDNTHLNSAIDVTNNIVGLDISAVTFQGNGSAGYNLSGDAISLDAGITDSGTNSITNNVSFNVTLTANQAFDSSGGNDTLNFNGTINLGTFNLSLTTNQTNDILLSTLTGSGGLTFNGASGGHVGTYQLGNPDPSYTGAVTINNDAAVQDLSGSLNGLGTGLITINSGGSLYLQDASLTGTFANALKLNGSGDGVDNFGALISCLGTSCTSSNSVLTLSGNVSLSGNTKVINGAYVSGELSPPTHSATFNFTGNGTYNGFTLTAFASSNTIVDPPTAVSSGSEGSSSSGSSSTPSAPDTGVGIVVNHSKSSLTGEVLLALSLVLTLIAVSRRLNKNLSSRK